MLAVVRIRGIRKVRPKIRDTLMMLNLNKPNNCVVVPETPQYLGMINVVRDYVAFGKIDENLLYKLLYRKGRKGSKTVMETVGKEKLKSVAKEIFEGKKKLKDVSDPVFCLHPPRKGYKNIKMQWPNGDLGRWDDISKLVNRMV